MLETSSNTYLTFRAIVSYPSFSTFSKSAEKTPSLGHPKIMHLLTSTAAVCRGHLGSSLGNGLPFILVGFWTHNTQQL